MLAGIKIGIYAGAAIASISGIGYAYQDSIQAFKYHQAPMPSAICSGDDGIYLSTLTADKRKEKLDGWLKSGRCVPWNPD